MKKNPTIKGNNDSWVKKLYHSVGMSASFIGLIVLLTSVSLTLNAAPVSENMQQQASLTGKVVDSSGDPLPGVNVFKKGTTEGTITNIDGEYLIGNVSEGTVIVFSFIGMLTQEVTYNGQASLDVTMEPDAIGLEEVVAVGYGTVKKQDLTGSVGSVAADQIESRGSTDAIEALQGQLPGVNITRSSGRSDVGFDMVIRGQNSLAGGSPLYVVDGLVVDNIDFLNPNDITQMDVLKDASSTAIYGSRGSNGVVLIKTKGASEASEKISISYDGYYGVKMPAHKAPMMNAEEWLNYYIASKQGNNTEPWSGNLFGGTNQVFTMTGDDWDREIQRRIAAGETYNWEDEFMENGYRQNHYVNLKGVSGKTSFSMTAGYQDEKGFIEKDFMKKYTFSLDLKHKFNDKWETGGQIRTGFKETEVAGGKSILNFYRMAPITLSSDPTGALFDDEGITLQPARMLSSSMNPLLDQKYSNTNNRSIDLIGKIYFNYKPVDWLSLRTDFLPRFSWLREGEWNGLYSDQAKGAQEQTEARARNRHRVNYTWDNMVNFKKSFNQHTIQATGLFSLYHFEEEDYDYQVQDLSQNTSFYNMGAANIRNLSESSYTMNRLVSYMARVNYDYAGKYLITLSNRWDGSSVLGEGHKWSAFPSAALAWRITEESWMENLSAITNLKARLSYGFTGNNNIAPYQSNVYPSNLYNYDFNGSLANGMAPSGIANRALTWERTEELNFGFDFGFFGGRISGTVDVYSRLSNNLLMDRKLAVPTGWDVMVDNIGSVKNEGIEASLRTINIKKANWTWETSFVFSKNKNSVVETNLGKVDDVVNGLFIGQPINVHYTYKMDGVWQLGEEDAAAVYGREPGMVKIKDINNDDKITDEDRTIIGKPIPDWTGSFYTKVSYKNIDLSMSLYTEQGIMKQSRFYNDLIYANRNTVLHNYWTVTNPSNEAPSPAFLEDDYWGRKGAQLQNYHDTSFTRIQNIILGYTLSKNIVEQLRIDRARIYANVTNPFLFTSFDGHDPEFGDKGANDGPSFMTVQFGINVNF